MNHHRFIFASMFSLPILLASLGGVRAAAQSAVVNWRSDFEQARAEAKQTGKPLFVVFR